MGWLTVLVYFLSAGLAGLVYSRRSLVQLNSRSSGFWLGIGIVLLFLGVNKQLDLQSLFTQWGRCLAMEHGWYAMRRGVQYGFLALLFGSIVVFVVAIAVRLRGELNKNALALAGMGFVLVFVFARAASFHHLDVAINADIVGFRINWLLELAGPLMVDLAALRLLISSRKRANFC